MERAESYKLSVAQGMMAWNPGEESEKMCGISKFSTRMQQGSVSGSGSLALALALDLLKV